MICKLSLNAQNTNLQVDGTIQLNTSTIKNPKSGMIRWNGVDLEVWNGLKWLSLTQMGSYDGEVVDIDGNIYPTIKLKDIEFMAENLRTTRYRNGDPIPQVTDQTAWANQTTGAWCWYDNDSNYDRPYGKLYNWYVASDSRNVCPEGWHIITIEEWFHFSNYFGPSTTVGSKLKESGSAHWINPNLGATNESQFTGLPGGNRSAEGLYSSIYSGGYWWSISEDPTTHAFLSHLTGALPSFLQVSLNKKTGASIRCFKG